MKRINITTNNRDVYSKLNSLNYLSSVKICISNKQHAVKLLNAINKTNNNNYIEAVLKDNNITVRKKQSSIINAYLR